ncbi:MAG: hypothetical protein R2726_18030 [Acidimicrobiales bacterium]
MAGGLGATPHPALALEEFTSREDLLPTIEACVCGSSSRPATVQQAAARMKWLVDTIGFEELQRRVLAQRRLLPASSSWPGGIPEVVHKLGDEPAGVAADVTPTAVGQGTPVTIRRGTPYERWEDANVVRGVAKGTVSAIAYARLGDVTADQLRGLAAIQRELGLDIRITNRQNLALRGLSEHQLPTLHARLQAIGMG